MTFGALPINYFTLNALPIANMVEMLTLSFALAYRIQIINNEKIEALAKARDKERYERLVRVLSHDVANSLTVVNSYAKKLVKNHELKEEIRHQVQKIVHAGENIKNILQIVREQQIFVSSKNGLELRQVNVLECLNFSKTLHEDMLQAKNIHLKINIPNDLFIIADQTCFINNIVNNIISNAIKFSFNDSEIEVYSTKSSDFNFIYFKDTGVGIESELINDIFFSEKIVSTSGTKDEQGHGLGTNLIREYMTLFDGKLQVTSITQKDNSVNHGTIIKLIFPKES